MERSKVSLFRNDLTRTGFYLGDDFNAITDTNWVFKTGGAIRSTPVYYDQKILFGSSDGTFYALDATNGKEYWHFRTKAAIHSSAAVFQGNAYFINRDNTLFSMDIRKGEVNWEMNLGDNLAYPWGFDYYLSSPVIDNNTLYIGSGNGSMFAIDIITKKVKWTFPTGSPVHSSPALAEGLLYFGNLNGSIYALDAITGKQQWIIKTRGDTLNNESAGFDRKAIIASPALKDGILILGGRDGYLYALDAKTGKPKWDYNYDISWVVSSAAIKDSIVVSGTSDGHLLNAFNLYSGKKLWEFQVGAPIFSSPIIIGNTILSPCNDGNIYTIDLLTGKEKDRYRIADKFFSSAVYNEHSFYIGNDDGNLYSLSTSTQKKMPAAQKAVFWIKDPINQVFKNGTDLYIRDYFVASGYQLVGEDSLKTFFEKQIKDTGSTRVVVFATNYFPENIVKGDPQKSPLYTYLSAGGKIVVLGPNPAIYQYDYAKKQFGGLNYTLSAGITGIDYGFKDLRSFHGFYPSFLTKEGKNWGLTKTVMTHSSLAPEKVTPLAIDEMGNAAYWVKNYGHKTGTGFVQLWINPTNLSLLEEIKKAAEYGLHN